MIKELTNDEILGLIKGINQIELHAGPIPINPVGFAFTTTKSNIEKPIKNFHDLRLKIVNDNAEKEKIKGKDGKEIEINKKDKDGNVVFKDKEKVDKEYRELLDQKVSVEVYMIPLDSFNVSLDYNRLIDVKNEKGEVVGQEPALSHAGAVMKHMIQNGQKE